MPTEKERRDQPHEGEILFLTLDFTDEEAAQAAWNTAFQHPETTYLVTPIDREVALLWIKDHAWMRSFGWGDPERHVPLRYNELIHLDELYYRGRCGWTEPQSLADHHLYKEMEETDGGGYYCYHPEVHDHRCCIDYECPIACTAQLPDLKEHDSSLYEQYLSLGHEEGEDCGQWMVLETRPRWAYVPNIRLVDTLQEGN